METYRLKNIAILILLLLNAFLLLLLGSQFFQARRAETDAASQLSALYAANQLSLSGHIDLDQQSLTPLILSRRGEKEQEIAAFLLGSDVTPSSQGGGIFSYTGESGSLHFRAGGSFDGSHLRLAVDDITEFAQQFCRQFGYEQLDLQIEDRTGSAFAVQHLTGVPISGCEVRLVFDQGVLTEVSGAHVNLEDAAPESAERMTCITALVRFLDYRNAAGVVCSEVTDAQCIYELQSGTALRLLPMWRIEADTYTYFINCATGEISRH